MAPLHLTQQEASYTNHHKVVGPFFRECPHPKALPYSTLCDVASSLSDDHPLQDGANHPQQLWHSLLFFTTILPFQVSNTMPNNYLLFKIHSLFFFKVWNFISEYR
jgi:hypothetical protein